MLSDAKDLFEITLEGNHSTADVPAIVLSSPKSRLCKTLRSAHNGKIVLHHESPRRPLLWMLSASLLGTLSRSIVPLSLADELTTSTSRREDGRGRKKEKRTKHPNRTNLTLPKNSIMRTLTCLASPFRSLLQRPFPRLVLLFRLLFVSIYFFLNLPSFPTLPFSLPSSFLGPPFPFIVLRPACLPRNISRGHRMAMVAFWAQGLRGTISVVSRPSCFRPVSC